MNALVFMFTAETQRTQGFKIFKTCYILMIVGSKTLRAIGTVEVS
jgi:hypothetical protein